MPRNIANVVHDLTPPIEAINDALDTFLEILRLDSSKADKEFSDGLFAIDGMVQLMRTYLKELNVEAKTLGLSKEATYP
jgi:hypothetical protein